ncbi:hypothetical protein BDN72DRAFT_436291 [Pluteus cervinus]|uniref:Uncharacterized protein n=1 Tax=Pluteus cervinus TaxID=181527 RepID=A0ACD3B0Q3_9AGAR|nr:hypothetical protein BDN72DRAFT_436291 [Pluteus cervinus]
MHNQPTGFSTLSAEVLDTIFEPLYPVRHLNAREWFDFDQKFTFVTDNFFRARKLCMNFRALNKACYFLLTPRIYSHFVLPMRPAEEFRRRIQATKYHPDLIKVLFLQGEDHTDEHFQRDTINLLHDFLSACPNLQDIHFFDPPNIFFQVTKSRIHQLLSGVGALSSLTLHFNWVWNVEFALGAVLIGLGHLAGQLERLDLGFYVEAFQQRHGPDRPVTVPSIFPRLRTLALRDCRDALAIKILSRINCGGNHSNCTLQIPCTPLRDLTITYLEYKSPPLHIPNLLKVNNLGLTLTTLQIFVLYGELQDDLPSQIFELCPKLEKLIYLAPFLLSSLDSLPQTLHALGVRFTEQRADCISNPKNLVDLIQDSTRRKGLKELYIDEVLQGKKTKELIGVCAANGVTLRGYWNVATEMYRQMGPDAWDLPDVPPEYMEHYY